MSTSLKGRIDASPTLWAARSALGRALAPALRPRVAQPDHLARVHWIRRLVPGSLIQVTEEITAFGELAAAQSPQRVCEIGTFNGGTSLFLAGLAPSVRSYVGIDLEPKNSELVHALAPRSLDFAYLVGSSRDPEIRRALSERMGGEPLDVLFIDGDHSYDGVRADFVEFRSLVRPGGLIAFHDIVPHPRGDAGDVPAFWQDVKDLMPSHELVHSRDQQGFGIGVLEHEPAASL